MPLSWGVSSLNWGVNTPPRGGVKISLGEGYIFLILYRVAHSVCDQQIGEANLQILHPYLALDQVGSDT